MGPASHFLFGTLCGAAIGGVAVAVRRRLALYLPPFILACGFWAEMPCLAGAPEAAHPAANIFFGYAWLHPWLEGHETAGLLCVVAVANVLMLGYTVYLTWFFWTVDSVRWELEGIRPGGHRSSRRRSKRRGSKRRRRSSRHTHTE